MFLGMKRQLTMIVSAIGQTWAYHELIEFTGLGGLKKTAFFCKAIGFVNVFMRSCNLLPCEPPHKYFADETSLFKNCHSKRDILVRIYN